jgi:hypothetical protein
MRDFDLFFIGWKYNMEVPTLYKRHSYEDMMEYIHNSISSLYIVCIWKVKLKK